MQTESEALFERFCAANGILQEPIPVARTKTADYRMIIHDRDIIAEVKQLDPNEEDKEHANILLQSGVAGRSYIVGKRLRQEVVDSRKQIRALAKNRHPGLLIVYNNVPFGQALTDPIMVKAAMYGEMQAVFAVPADPNHSPYLIDERFGGKRTVSEQHNTTLSALCVLHVLESGEPALTFYHNAFAAIKFDPDWLRTNSVKHYGLLDPSSHRLEEWRDI